MKPNFSIKALADGEVEILFYDEIGASFFGEGITLKDFAAQLKAAEPFKKITLRINSPGGDAFEGMAIYDVLIQQKADVAVIVDGLAASIASVIAMAGRSISMAENAFLMMHGPWAVALGDADDLRGTAELLDKLRGRFVATYTKRSKQDEATIADMVDAETWLTAEEALDLGFSDQTIEGPAVQASLDPEKWGKRYKHIPRQLKSGSARAAAKQKQMPRRAGPKSHYLVVDEASDRADLRVKRDDGSADFPAMVRAWKTLQETGDKWGSPAASKLKSLFRAQGYSIPERASDAPYLERRIYNPPGLTVKAQAQETVISGYAAVFNSLSAPLMDFRERINSKAFERTLTELADVRSLINHDPNLILGRTAAKTLELGADEQGLWYRVTLPATGYAQDLAESISRGDVRQSSFSFRARKERWQMENGEAVRELMDVELYDVGPATFPAYTQTRVEIRGYLDFLEGQHDGISTAASARQPETDPKVLEEIEEDERRFRQEVERGKNR